MPKFVRPEEMLDILKWRYATKIFDATKKIPDAQWKALEDALILSPSSYGLQPWKFILVSDRPTLEKLKAVSWNQSQVTDCSHFVVFAPRTDMTVKDVEHFVDRMVEVRGVPKESLDTYRDMMVGDVVKGPRHENIRGWASLQTYIALGNFMTSAAMVGIDTCPMEGLDPAKYDEILQLNGTGYATLCACAVGYRAASDKYATLPKVRYPKTEMIRKV